ncbi:MAG: pepsin/retropepsin-like aspartic protease family protein [Ferruginibacter sp.]
MTIACPLRDSLPLQISFLSALQQDGSGESDSSSCIIPFTRAGNLILVKAKVDGTTGNFILDTGAPGLVLNITYFRSHSVSEENSEEQRGITGTVGEVKKAEIADIGFGCIKAGRITADIVSLSHLENTKGVRIFGLLGLSLLKQFEVIIDYENNELQINRVPGSGSLANPANTVSGKEVDIIPIQIWDNKIVTNTSVGGKKLRLIIDSGAESNLLDGRLPAKVLDSVDITKRIMLNGAGARRVEALYGNLHRLMLGDAVFFNLPVIVTNLANTCLADNSCADGILGYDFLSLHKIGFNFVNNKMYIWK